MFLDSSRVAILWPSIWLVTLTVSVGTVNAQNVEAAEDESTRTIEEVVVTATKRAKSVRDIPASIDAFSGQDLEERGASGFEDFIKFSPGVSFSPGAPDRATIAVRGVATETSGQVTSVPTGLFFDDVPLANPSLANSRPSIEAFDLETVEVLKGPQGTLFGGSALAGAVRFVPMTPNFEEVTAKFTYGVTELEHSADHGIFRAAMLNVPLTDWLALRVAATDRSTPGYIDDTRRNLSDIDSSDVEQFRGMVAARPIDDLLVQYTRQDIEIATDDLSFADNREEFTRNTTPGASPLEATIEIESGKLQYDTPWFAVIGIYSELNKPRVQQLNVDRVVGTQDLGDVSRQTSTFTTLTRTRELRLVSSPEFNFSWGPLGGVEWLIGYFNMTSDQQAFTDIDADFNGLDPTGLGLLGPILNGIAPTLLETTAFADAEEDALFVDTTWYLWDAWELNLGFRKFEQETDGGAIAKAAGIETTNVSQLTKESGVNPKVALTWRATDSIQVIASRSEGFRFGGVNAILGPNTDDVPVFYDSDELTNYELSLRTDWFDRTLRADLTYFEIDWERLQIRQRASDGINQFLDNVGGAHNEGLELSVQAVLPYGLFLSANASRITAETSEPFESVDGEVPPGTTLPATPKHQRSVILNHSLPLANWIVSSSVSYSWRSDAFNNLQHDFTLSAYETWDLGVTVSNDFLRIAPRLSLNVSNVKDEKTVTNIVADAGTSGFQDLYFNRPRTVSLQLSLSF